MAAVLSSKNMYRTDDAAEEVFWLPDPINGLSNDANSLVSGTNGSSVSSPSTPVKDRVTAAGRQRIYTAFPDFSKRFQQVHNTIVRLRQTGFKWIK